MNDHEEEEEAEDLGAPVAPVKLKHCPRLGYKVAPAACEEQKALCPRACERACGQAGPPNKEEAPMQENTLEEARRNGHALEGQRERLSRLSQEKAKRDRQEALDRFYPNAPPLPEKCRISKSGFVWKCTGKKSYQKMRIGPCGKHWIANNNKRCWICEPGKGSRPAKPVRTPPHEMGGSVPIPERPFGKPFSVSIVLAKIGAACARPAHQPSCKCSLTPDLIKAPPHYCAGVIECLDVIRALGFDFEEGNALKYLFRHKRKGTPLEDLKKSRFYIDALIKRYEAKP